ncbi:hypothetical protein F511_30799 [Dorcoceras hygrometricum]|uniref:Uncharacterized protein n=1 Tax=Dorcoceras hygrometricum TaxID=472368 RepID=A0A2Z7A629_9LAMI|nr:hypothetical protein F511_30799 [Dorcoceras hygrometricum]
MGPISNTGPKTSRAARDRPEQNPRRIQPSDIAGASPDVGRRRRPPPTKFACGCRATSRQARRTAACNVARPMIIVDRRAAQPVHDVQPSSGRSLCAIVRQAHGAAVGAHHRACCAQQPSASLRSAQQFERKS